MSIGIYSRYRRHDATLAALALARFLRQRASDFSLFARDWRVPYLDPDWDNKIGGYQTSFHPRAVAYRRAAHKRQKAAYRKWVAKHSLIIWTEPPAEDDLYWAKKNHKNTHYAWCSWDTISQHDEWALNISDRILMPSKQQYEAVTLRFKIPHVEIVPYVPCLPTTFKGPKQDQYVRLFLSLYGSQLRQVEKGALQAMLAVMRRNKHVRCVVAGSKGLKSYIVKDMQRYANDSGGRFGFVRDCSWPQQVSLMGQADLVLWPCLRDGFGVVAKTAFAMGTPVAAFGIYPVHEYLNSGVDSVVLPCNHERNWLSVEHAQPDYHAYTNMIDEAIAKPNYLALLAIGASNSHLAAHAAFVEAWGKHLPAS